MIPPNKLLYKLYIHIKKEKNIPRTTFMQMLANKKSFLRMKSLLTYQSLATDGSLLVLASIYAVSESHDIDLVI